MKLIEARYLTDDRDLPEERQRELVVQQHGNGDYYVSVTGKGLPALGGVRISTSGGASFLCPGLTDGVSTAMRAMAAAQKGEKFREAPYSELEREVQAWRRLGAEKYEYDRRSGEVLRKEEA